MGSNFDAVSGDSVVDELVILWRKLVEALLDDVVAIQVLDQDDDMQAESDDDGMDLDKVKLVKTIRPAVERSYLAARRKEVDHLLNRTCTMHVEGDVDQILRDRLADQVALLIGAVLEELLAKVVAKRIWKQMRSTAWMQR